MSKFTVVRKRYIQTANIASEEIEIQADKFYLDEGHLRLLDHNSSGVALFAPGEWVSVVEQK